MTEVFLVLERAYEYNYETYDSSEGGNVLTAYSSQAEAERVAKVYTREVLGTQEDLAEYMDPSYYTEVFNLLGFEQDSSIWDFDSAAAFNALSPERQEQVVEAVGDRFYFVRAVELAA